MAELNLESERTRGRLELQAKQIGAIEERLAAGEAETQELKTRHQREHRRSWKFTRKRSPRLEAQTEAAARASGLKKPHERDALQNDLRERERGRSKPDARQVLRLLGEASTLRNQLAQIDEYLAAIERDSARARKEEGIASADLDAAGRR